MDRVGVDTLRRAVDEARARGVDRQAADLMQWAHDLLGPRLMMSTAFGKGGMCLLHMMREIAPGMPIYFLDTGFHFQETLQFVEELRASWGVELVLKRPRLFGDDFKKAYGRLPSLYASQGYDTARLIGSAIKAVGGDMSKKDAFREALRRADFESVRGPFRFGPNQHPVQDIYIREVVEEDGLLTNQIVTKAFTDHSDAYVGECKMQ